MVTLFTKQEPQIHGTENKIINNPKFYFICIKPFREQLVFFTAVLKIETFFITFFERVTRANRRNLRIKGATVQHPRNQ
jgi:hypothetical protein